MAVIALDRGREAERRMLAGRRKRKATLAHTFNHTGPESHTTSYSASITKIRQSQPKPEEER